MHKPLKFFYDLLLQISRIPGLGWTVRPLKLVIYTLEGLMTHGTMDMGAALTFYALISIVPVLALVFAVVNGFGLVESLVANLYSLLPQMPEVVDYIVDFANRALARTQGGIVATVSLLTLFWAVIRMFESIEINFNKIWEVKSTRNLVRKYCDYITVVIIAPLLWIVATSISSYARQVLGVDGSVWLQLGSKIVSMVVVWAMFALIYLVLPNTKVRLRSALLAGIMAGSCFYAFQAIYIYLLKWMTSYSAIYGSFAALPLFLLWMQNSWSILLIGCELSFAIQNEKRFDEERMLPNVSPDDNRKLMIAITAFVARAFKCGEGAVPMVAIREGLALPTRIASKLVQQLVAAEVLNEVRRDEVEYDVAYAPARDINTLRVCDVLSAVDSHVDGTTEDLCGSAIARRSQSAVDGIKQVAAESDENRLILEISDNE
ncbi:MAG: YihY/virulence factor BrkB family protein [Alistipes sp.]|nr:YihY/virulence factor BrkB family protein [Alistipes sp.]